MQSTSRADILAKLRARHAAGKRVNEDLKAARARLARGSTIKPEFEYELLVMFAKNELGAAVTIWALSVIFSLASMFWATKTEAVLWLASDASSFVNGQAIAVDGGLLTGTPRRNRPASTGDMLALLRQVAEDQSGR